MSKWVYREVVSDSVVETLNGNEIETLFAFARSGMKVHTTGRDIFLNDNTVRYRLNKVKQKTGLNPFKFWDLLNLVLSLEKADGSM